MKNAMRFLAVALAIVFHTSAMADNDKPVTVNQLPAAAQQVIKKHFAKKGVALAKMESGLFEKSYDVIFTNGDKVEFDRNGKWTELDCSRSAVPSALVPGAIRNHVARTYPGVKILKIEKEDKGGYEVKLSNRVELTFNGKLQLIDIDN